MRNMQEGRILFISSAKVFGILLVVLGHSFPFDVPIPRLLEQLRTVIYSFHMPLFVMISGYLAARSNRRPREYVVNRAKKLLIPYFALSLAAFLPKLLVQQYLNDSVEFSIAYLIRSEFVPRENVWGHFWYIPVIFLFGSVNAVLGRQIRNRKPVRIGMLAGAYLLLWLPETTGWLALEDCRKLLFYYILGMEAHNLSEFCSIIKNRAWLLGIPVVWLLCAIGKNNGHGFTVIIALMAIGNIFCLGTFIDVRKYTLLSCIERNNFTIYLLSWPAQAVAEVLFNKILHLPVLLCMAAMFIAGLFVPIVCAEFVEWLGKRRSVRWLRFVLGM